MEPLQTETGKRIVLHEGQYKEVYVTGSNLPVFTPNDFSIRPLPTTSQTYTMSPEAFQEWVRRGDAISPYRR